MQILDGKPLVFVDVETNGISHTSGHVIEVGAIRVEDGKVVRSFNKLIDPGRPIPAFITRLTGITDDDLKSAPMFADIADELHDLLDGAVFVAHNVRFDYSFLKTEFKRVGKTFLPKQLCTVKLSRALFPEESSHKLEAIIRRYNFKFDNRHRAYDDAHVLWQFIKYIQINHTVEAVQEAISKQLRTPSLPKNIPAEVIKGLPNGPGVYIFEDELGKPLYIGKSINIRKRVMQHFGSDHAVTTEFKIAQAIKHVSFRETPGELAALLLESQLVKELQPLHNKKLRRTKKMLLARQHVNEDGYIEVRLEDANEIKPSEHAEVLAVYPQRGKARQSFDQTIKDFSLCPKLFGVEKATRACFLHQLQRCHGACVGKESPESYNARLLTAFEQKRIHAWPYKSPMLVVEKQPASDHEIALVVDQWCVLAEIDQQEHCDPVVRLHDKAFDLDTYRILTSFLGSKIDRLWLKPFPVEQLRALQA